MRTAIFSIRDEPKWNSRVLVKLLRISKMLCIIN
jgi:hypothetical protein